jgi:putative addiction module killer protein
MYPVAYTKIVIEILQTEAYSKWFDKLKDRSAKARIITCIRRMSLGNFGDVKPVGEGVSEIRIDHGPGYRIYFVQRGMELVILLAGGDKKTQDKDVTLAKELAERI